MRLALRKGSIVTSATVLGHLGGSSSRGSAYLRFAIRPAGDSASVNPSTIISSWRELDLALGRRARSGGDGGLLGTGSLRPDVGCWLGYQPLFEIKGI